MSSDDQSLNSPAGLHTSFQPDFVKRASPRVTRKSDDVPTSSALANIAKTSVLTDRTASSQSKRTPLSPRLFWNIYLNIALYALCLQLWGPLLPYFGKELGATASEVLPV